MADKEPAGIVERLRGAETSGGQGLWRLALAYIARGYVEQVDAGGKSLDLQRAEAQIGERLAGDGFSDESLAAIEEGNTVACFLTAGFDGQGTEKSNIVRGRLRVVVEELRNCMQAGGVRFDRELRGDADLNIPIITGGGFSLMDVDANVDNLLSLGKEMSWEEVLRTVLVEEKEVAGVVKSGRPDLITEINRVTAGFRLVPKLLAGVEDGALFLEQQMTDICKKMGVEVGSDMLDRCLFAVCAMACPHDFVTDKNMFLVYSGFPNDTYYGLGNFRNEPRERFWELETTVAREIYLLIKQLGEIKKDPEWMAVVARTLVPDEERQAMLGELRGLERREGDLNLELAEIKAEKARLKQALGLR